MGVVLKPLFCFLEAEFAAQCSGINWRAKDARKRGERSAKGLDMYLIMARPIMKDETKTRLRKSTF